jgi:fructose-bisphosphate aldolase class II
MNRSTREIVLSACRTGLAVPAWNICHLPMMAPVVDALRDTETFGLIQVARPDWTKFGAESLEAVADDYHRLEDERFTRLHLDHVPAIDEDGETVDYLPLLARAVKAGYQSLMFDGSRLSLDDNIRATSEAADLAREADVPLEAELGAVLGHESGPLPPYEEIFRTGQGFTDPDQAARFVAESRADWLSVAIGNIHGAISRATRDAKKVEARLDLDHLDRIRAATGVPLVLHGGSGIRKLYIQRAFRHGIAKINVATAIRQPFEAARAESEAAAHRAVYDATVAVITDELGLAGSAAILNPPA